MTHLIGVGDNTVDTYTHLGMRFPGGNAVNVAVLAQRCGHPAAYLGWLGDDEDGRLIYSALQQERLDLSHCRVVAGQTAYSTVMLVDGDRVFGPADPGVCPQIALDEQDYAYLGQFDVVHSSVFSHLENGLAALKRASHCLSFDFSQERSPEYLERVLPHIDVALLSCSDLALEAQQQLMCWIYDRMYPGERRLVLVTRGSEGAWVYDGQAFYHQGILPVEVIDTLGAGDAFAAHFLVEALDGTPIQQAMYLAAGSAAENCKHYGAFGYGQPI